MADNVQLTGWMTASAKGDEAAFGHMARALAPTMMATALRHTQNRAMAEDAVQDALIKLWTHAPRFQPGGSVGAYAQRLVHTAAMDLWRGNKIIGGPAALELMDADGPQPETLSGTVFAKEKRQALVAAMAQLPERQRKAVQLAYLQEQPTREVAAHMGLHEKAADALLVRARRTLAKVLPKNLMGDL